MDTPDGGYRNRLLTLLPTADLALLSASFERISLRVRDELEKPTAQVQYVYFPEDGIVSVVATLPGKGSDLEVGIIGRDGMTGTGLLLGDDTSTDRVFVQIAGHGHRISAKHFLDAIGASESMSKLLLRYARFFGIQLSSTALAYGRCTLEVRLARWLLLCRDRLETDAIELTHIFLATMLGVRRSGVTLALQGLEGKGFIRSLRGVVRISDRAGLVRLAGGSYGVPETNYERLLGPLDEGSPGGSLTT